MKLPTPAVPETESLDTLDTSKVSTGEILLRVMQEDNRSVHNLFESKAKTRKKASGFFSSPVVLLGLLTAGPAITGIYKLLGSSKDDEGTLDALEADADEAESLGLNEKGIAKDDNDTSKNVKKFFGDLTGSQHVLGTKAAPVKQKVEKAQVRAITKGLATPSADVDFALKAVAAKTAVDYHTLYALAGAESSFKSTAKAKSSSAEGLTQFTKSTWKGMLKKYPNLKYTEDDRADPYKSATMSALYLTEIKASMSKALGRDPDVGELYLGYFLGPSGARSFLRALKQNPKASAPKAFPSAAKANKNLFYEKGKPLSLQDCFNKITGKVNAYYTASVNRAGSTVATTTTKPIASKSGTGSVTKDSEGHKESVRVAQVTPATSGPMKAQRDQAESKGKATAIPMTVTPTESKPSTNVEDEDEAEVPVADGPLMLPTGSRRSTTRPDYVRTRSGMLVAVPS